MNWLFFALLAVIFASVRSITHKRALQDEDVSSFLVVRGFYMLILAFTLLPWMDFDIPLEGYAWCFLVALVATFAITYRSIAFKNEDISILSPLGNLVPIFTAVIAFIFLGEKLTLLQIGGVFLIVFGMYVLQIDHKNYGLLAPFKRVFENRYTRLTILAGLIFSVTITLDRFVLQNYTEPLTYFFLVHVFMFVLLTLRHFYKQGWRSLFDSRHHNKWTVITSVFYVLFLLTFYEAISLAYAGLVAAVMRMQNLITTVEGGRFFQEEHLKKKSLACLIMVVGAVLVVI